MEFDYYSPSETFVVLTADQFVGRDDGDAYAMPMRMFLAERINVLRKPK